MNLKFTNFFALMNDKSHLLAMGFTEVQVTRALRKTKNQGLQPAMDWILEHGEDPVSDAEINPEEDQLMEDNEVIPLSDEQKQQKLLDLKERMKLRREERLRLDAEEEKKRHIVKKATAAEMAALREKIQDQEMKKEVAERRRQKEEDRKAREEVKRQLELDKLERKREQEEKYLISSGVPLHVVDAPKPVVLRNNYDEARIQVLYAN
jgi:UBX domain-containing protein 1/4